MWEHETSAQVYEVACKGRASVNAGTEERNRMRVAMAYCDKATIYVNNTLFNWLNVSDHLEFQEKLWSGVTEILGFTA